MRKLILALVAAALIAPMAMAQDIDYDFNIMGTGARARGMGGAFIGVADDATAVGWNPAGLAQLDKMEASAVGLFNMLKYSSEVTIGTTSETYTGSASHIAPAFASFVVPVKTGNRNIAFAVAYQRMIDMGNTAKGSEDDPFLGTYTWIYEATGGMDAISPAAAIQLSENFSLGLAANIYMNGLKYNYDENYASISSWDKYKYEEKYSGFNLNAGALVSLQKFSIGAMARFPFSLGVDVTESNTWDYTANGGNAGTVTNTMTGAEFSMPMMLGFGVAVKPTDKLTLAADYEIRSYSNSEFSYQGYTDNAGMNDCNQIRVGMEYILTGPSAVFPVRLGFRTDPRTYDGFKGTFSNPDTSQASGTVITGGFGLIMGKMMLDLAYEYGSIKPVDVSEDFGGTLVAMKTEQKSHNIMLSLIYHFK
jgi:long-subunit fatty acid transport protein